jgi:hypothetical protein
VREQPGEQVTTLKAKKNRKDRKNLKKKKRSSPPTTPHFGEIFFSSVGD